MNDQVSRLYRILQLLPRYPKYLTIGKLKDQLLDHGFKVTIRTLQRDLNTLSEIFLDIDKETQTDHSVGWFWSERAKTLSISGLSINQALSLNLAEKYLRPLLPETTLNELNPFFEQAKETLSGLESNPVSNWLDKIAVVLPTQPLLPPAIGEDIQKSIYHALLVDKQLSIQYRRADHEEKAYVLNPLGIVVRGSVNYLIATKVDSNTPQMFALHRMLSASIENRTATRPASFSLTEFVSQGHVQFHWSNTMPEREVVLKARFDTDFIKFLLETPLSKDQVVEPLGEGKFLLTATVKETGQLFWWLLGLGYHVEVLEPASLRKKIKETVIVSARKYEGGGIPND
jgi:predicted DNA-binding transcriptional regulator YafY